LIKLQNVKYSTSAVFELNYQTPGLRATEILISPNGYGNTIKIVWPEKIYLIKLFL
jgi:hypothetical protein